MFRSTLMLVLLVGFASPAIADIAPPPPAKGLKRVPYEFIVKLGGEVPGYKFYTFQRLGIGGHETIGEELKLGTENGVSVPSSSSPSVRTGLVAVPEKVMDELKSKENLAKLLARDAKDKLPAGVAIFETRGTIRDVLASDPRSKVENVVTVTADEKAGVKFSAQETPPPPPKKASHEPGGRPPVATLIASIATALAVVTAGLWYVRRK